MSSLFLSSLLLNAKCNHAFNENPAVLFPTAKIGNDALYSASPTTCKYQKSENIKILQNIELCLDFEEFLLIQIQNQNFKKNYIT